ncbi:MAG: trypsin-like peptidase domain-containing protein [Oscillospiraceae bacterium]|nr:trypsin-like peptidase domain-containing protein [Oscillospiraceae bacterium]
MYYEDENNLYHYSYRKGDKSVVEPVYNTRNYAEEPAEAEQPKRKRGRGLGLVALMLVCALIGGLVGAGASRVTGAKADSATRGGSTSIEVSDREGVDVQTVAVNGTKKLTLPELYKANINSVVSINTTITTNVFNQTVQSASAGSGFIITSDGYIVTNYHVIDSANDVKVTLYDGKEYEAKVIGGDSDYDIAVLKIEATGLQAVTLGNSATLQIGDDIAAIGNPLGELTFSMSEGIVSCVDREINLDGTPFNMIQVTAAINPGNSGGPLFNTYGEVVGIVSAKYTAYANTVAEGLGFAIPINDVIAMVEDIMENGRVTNRPYFGITVENVTARRAQQNGYSVDAGVRVSSVETGGAADKAGIKAGDIIVKLGDRDVTSITDLNAAKKTYKAGDTATVTVNRNGELVELSITFDAVPEQTATAQQPQNQQPGNGDNYYYYGGDGNNGYFDPWDFFNQFFGNVYGSNGSSNCGYGYNG